MEKFLFFKCKYLKINTLMRTVKWLPEARGGGLDEMGEGGQRVQTASDRTRKSQGRGKVLQCAVALNRTYESCKE